MIFESSNFDIKRNKKDQYSIKKWRAYISSVIEIKHLLEGDSKRVLDKIRSDFNKLKKAKIEDSYVVLLNHSSNDYEDLIKKIKYLTIKDKAISVFYSNMKKGYLIRKGEVVK